MMFKIVNHNFRFIKHIKFILNQPPQNINQNFCQHLCKFEKYEIDIFIKYLVDNDAYIEIYANLDQLLDTCEKLDIITPKFKVCLRSYLTCFKNDLSFQIYTVINDIYREAIEFHLVDWFTCKYKGIGESIRAKYDILMDLDNILSINQYNMLYYFKGLDSFSFLQGKFIDANINFEIKKNQLKEAVDKFCSKITDCKFEIFYTFYQKSKWKNTRIEKNFQTQCIVQLLIKQYKTPTIFNQKTIHIPEDDNRPKILKITVNNKTNIDVVNKVIFSLILFLVAGMLITGLFIYFKKLSKPN